MADQGDHQGDQRPLHLPGHPSLQEVFRDRAVAGPDCTDRLRARARPLSGSDLGPTRGRPAPDRAFRSLSSPEIARTGGRLSLFHTGAAAEEKVMNRDVAPVIAAQALLAHAMDDRDVLAYVQRTWRLDSVNARAAVDAAHTLAGHHHGVRIARRADQ